MRNLYMGQQHQHVPVRKTTAGRGMPLILTYTRQELTDLAQGSISRCLRWPAGPTCHGPSFSHLYSRWSLKLKLKLCISALNQQTGTFSMRIMVWSGLSRGRSQAWSRRRAHGLFLVLMENLADDLNRFFDRFDSPTFIPVCTTRFLAWCVFPSPNHSIYNMLQRAHAHLDT